MKVRSVKFNFAMNLLLTASTYLFPLITFPYVSRTLQPAAYGQANYAMGIVNYFSLLAMLGVNMYGARECAKVRDDGKALAKTAEELVLLTLTTSLLSLTALYLCIFFLPALRGYTVLLVINSASLLLTTIGVEWFFKGVEQYAYITLRSLVVKTLSMLALFAFVHSPSDVYVYAAIYVVVNGGAFIWNFSYMLRNIGRDWLPIHELDIIRHLRPMLVLFLSSAAVSVYTNLDTVMLGAMDGDEAVGLYVAAVNIKTVLTSLTASLGGVITPRASYYVGQGRKGDFYELLRASSRFALVLSVPMAVVCYAFSDTIILVLAGSSYAASATLLRIFLPAVVFIGMTQITANQILLPMGKERRMALTYAVAAAVDFVLNLMLIPRHGAAGAATSTMIAEFVVLLMQAVAAWQVVRESRLIDGLWRLLVPIAVATLLLVVAMPLDGGGLLSAALLSGGYFVSLLVLLVACREPSTLQLLGTVRSRLAGIVSNRG